MSNRLKFPHVLIFLKHSQIIFSVKKHFDVKTFHFDAILVLDLLKMFQIPYKEHLVTRYQNNFEIEWEE